MSLITSTQNPLVKHLLKLQKELAYRKECRNIFLEGKKLVIEACKNLEVKHCILKEGLEIEGSFLKTYLTESLVQKISGLKNSEGYFAEVERPQNANLGGLEKILVLDRLQNPGNMGTLIRTAVAFGFEGIFVLEDSVDPYSPKVLRASMGASLYTPICMGSEEDLIQLAKDNKIEIFVADAKGTSIDKISIKKPLMLVLGNESKGSLLNAHSNSTTVSLPIERVDSLNVAVAGSLLMYLMRNYT